MDRHIHKNPLFDKNLIEKIILPLTEIENAPIAVICAYNYSSEMDIYYIPKDEFTLFYKKILELFSKRRNYSLTFEKIEEKIDMKIPKIFDFVDDFDNSLFDLIMKILTFWTEKGFLSNNLSHNRLTKEIYTCRVRED